MARSKAEWLSLFDAHSKSGLTAAEFCREHKLCRKYFSLRRKQLMSASLQGDRSSPSFVPAVVAPQLARDINITAGQVKIAIPVGVQSEWLADLIRSLLD